MQIAEARRGYEEASGREAIARGQVQAAAVVAAKLDAATTSESERAWEEREVGDRAQS